jgi:cytochrome b pre-mRNA-processing protein 3
VAQARTPVFYRSHGVPDTLEGRFDMVVLHLFLANRRLAGLGEEGMTLGQELLDFFFADMDASLREIGIGDLAVPKKMKGFAQAYMGRAAAYEAAIDKNDVAALDAAIARNIFGQSGGGIPGAALIARYVLAATAVKAATSDEAVAYPEIAEASAHG